VIERGALDERNFVKKAVNWALRNIGKRNWPSTRLPSRAPRESAPSRTIALAGSVAVIPQIASARWVANDALRELTSAKARARLKE